MKIWKTLKKADFHYEFEIIRDGGGGAQISVYLQLALACKLQWFFNFVYVLYFLKIKKICLVAIEIWT